MRFGLILFRIYLIIDRIDILKNAFQKMTGQSDEKKIN